MRNLILAAICLGASIGCRAQYFQFSQYNFTPQRINPATVATSDYASLSFDYRNQSTAGGFHLNSNIVNASYPILSRNGTRWSGVGISLMDDRSGQAGIFNTQEAAVSYAIDIPMAKYQVLAMGVKVLYQSRKINLDGLYTGSQYIPDRGFDESLASGENPGQLNTSFMTFSAGLFWQQEDRRGNRLAYAGFSFFDFNHPDDAFLDAASTLHSTSVATVGVRVYQKGNISIFPEALLTMGSGTAVFNVGGITRYDLKPAANQPATHLDLITKYVIGRSGIVGLQLHREKFGVGISYDFPVVTRNVANTGAIEVGVIFRKLVVSKKRTRDEAQRKATGGSGGKKLGATVAVKKPQPRPAAKDSLQTKDKKAKEAALSARLKQKQDSVRTHAQVGAVSHTPLVLEKATLHFNFEFNSTELDEHSREYLDDLAKALHDNPELKIKLTGHTDNIGSEKFNLKLSQYRAQTLKDYLLERGVEPSRITAEGKGMSEPIRDNKTEEGRSQNRRVELTILYQQ
jgi:type IX secretion system PorP/SprF family membrane protein